MRIGLVTPLYRPAMGGVEMHVEHLTAGLLKRGHEVEVLVQTHDRALPAKESIDGVLVRRFRVLAKSEHYPFAPGLARYLARNSATYDLIHAHNYHALPSLIAGVTAKAPFVFTPHYHAMSRSRFRNLLHRPYRIAGAFLARRAAVVIAVAPAEAELLSRDFPSVRSKLALIPNGVDAEAIAAAEPFEKAGKIVLLSAGRLDDYKRVDDTIRALQHLDSRYVLRVTGDGPARAELEALVRQLGLEDRVRLLGRVETAELYRWFRTADVYVTLSEIEAMPITPLETLSAGARVVASDIPAHRGTAKFGGQRLCLVGRNLSASELALTIASSAEGDPPGGEIPTWDQVVQQTLVVYQEAISGSGTPPKTVVRSETKETVAGITSDPG